MYIRKLVQKNKDGCERIYYQVCESIREGKKVKKRVLATLGRVGEAVTERKIDQLMESLIKQTGREQIFQLLKDLKCKQSKGFGELEVIRKVFKDLGLENILRSKLADTEKKIDYVEAIFMAICNRLSDSGSKKRASEWKEGMHSPNWEQLELQHVYRGMDFLIDQKDELEGALFDQTRTLFNSKVHVAMFDTTNVSYWGKGDDQIFQYGHSKNKRFDLKQLVVGIVMDRDGTPLGHEVWPGNMSDITAFMEVIQKVKKKFCIEKVVLVCDRGMICEKNISFLESENYEYILGVKIRHLSRFRQELLLKESDFEDLEVGGRLGKEILESSLHEAEVHHAYNEKKSNGIKPHPIDEESLKEYRNSKKGKRRWIACLNPILAQEDKYKREYFRKILENKVDFRTAKEWIVKNGYKKYVIIEDFKVKLDRDKLENEAIYDGKWCLITNTDFSISESVAKYKELAQIEQHFKVLKSEIELGPIYHWTEKRVRAHVFICFIALQIQAYITKKIKEKDPSISYRIAMNDVKKIRANYYQIGNKHYIQRTEFIGLADLVFKATGTKPPPLFLKIPDESKSVGHTS
jgi:transposase